jgi:glycosyltransferase involved in cell wall biosynthesis
VNARALAGAVRRRLRATRAVWAGDFALPPGGAATDRAARIDLPAEGQGVPRTTLNVAGWARADGGPVDRVELTLDGRPAGRARLGILRPDISPHNDGAHIVTAGFEAKIDLSHVPEGRDGVEVAGRAYPATGDPIDLAPVRVSLIDDEAKTWADVSERTAALRSRSARIAGAAVGATTAGVGDDRPLRVLVVTHHLGFGGAQLVLQELLRRFAQDGITGAVVGPDDGATREVIEAAGFAVHIAGEVSVHNVEEYEGWMANVLAWAAPQGFDAVIVNTMLCAHNGGDLADRLGLPALWIVHESYDLDGFWATYGDWLHPYVRERGTAAFARAAAVIFEVDATRHLLEGSTDPTRCLTIPYGIDVDALDRWADEWSRGRARELIGAAEQDIIVLCVGTIEPRKAQAQLVEAFARVESRHPHARLILVGGRGDGLERAPQIGVAAHGLERKVGVEPVHPDVRPYYRAADVLVCASDVESLPRSVLEAMALGVPVVATRVFGLPEVVREGETGWLCDARDTADLAVALDRALDTSVTDRRRIGAAARDLVRDEHEIDACAARYADVLRAVAAGTVLPGRARG